MDIKIDLSGITDLQRMGSRVDGAVETALDRSAQVALNATTRMARRTYARPIPRGKNGKPKWERSGALLNGQAIESKPRERSIVTTGKAGEPIKNYPGGYAEKLATLPTGRDGVSRRNAIHQDARDMTEPQVRAVFEQTLLNELGI